MVSWFIKNSVLVALFSLSINTAFSQNDQLFKAWPDSVLAQANSARMVEFMDAEEKTVVFYTNLVRINPSLFAKTYLQDYLKSNKIKKDKEIKELVKELEVKNGMSILQPNAALEQNAKKHAQDMGNTGRTGHSSSDGTSYKDRISKLTMEYNMVNENCSYGSEKGIDIFFDLLIDRNVPNYGHRKNILDPEMKFIGVAIEPHKRFKYNCVQDFAGSKIPQ